MKKVGLALFLTSLLVSPLTSETLTIEISQKPLQAAFPELVRAFEATHPGVKLKPIFTPRFEASRLMREAAYGNLPDLFQAPAWAADFELALNGYCANLDSLAKQMHVNPSFLPGVTFQGQVIALPTNVGAIGLVVNKALFARMDLPIPTTFKQLQQDAQILQANGITPFVGGPQALEQLTMLLHSSQLGVRGYQDSRGPEAVKRFAADMNWAHADWGRVVDLKQLLALVKWFQAHSLPPTSAAVATFTSEQVGMLFGNQDDVSAILDQQKVQGKFFGVAFIPFPWSQDPAQNRFFSSAENTFVVSTQASARHQRDAKAFLKFLASPHALEIWTHQCRLLPALRDVSLSGLPQGFSDIVQSEEQKGAWPWEMAMCPEQTWQDTLPRALREVLKGELSDEGLAERLNRSWHANYRP